jgi:predicted Zn finger-like uncharacterized protein
MPIATRCPGCKALFRLADDVAGKRVRCQKCSQLFVAPMPKSAPAAASPAAKPVDPTPAPAPIISMSLDEPTPPVENQASAEVIDAMLVDVPQSAEVVDAMLVEAPRPPELLDAILVEEPATEERPPPASNPKRPRRAGDLPKHSTFGSGVLAFLVLLLAGAVIIACFTGAWVVVNFDKGKKNAVLQPAPPKRDFPKPKEKDFFEKDK